MTAIIFAFIESNSLIGWLLETSGDDIASSLWPAFPPASHLRLFGRNFLQACLQRLFPEISSPSPPRGSEFNSLRTWLWSCSSFVTKTVVRFEASGVCALWFFSRMFEYMLYKDRLSISNRKQFIPFFPDDQSHYRRGPRIWNLTTMDFPALKMEPRSAHVVSTVPVHWLQCGVCDAAPPMQHNSPILRYSVLLRYFALLRYPAVLSFKHNVTDTVSKRRRCKKPSKINVPTSFSKQVPIPSRFKLIRLINID